MSRGFSNNRKQFINSSNNTENYEPPRQIRDTEVNYDKGIPVCWVPSLIWENAIPPEICKLIIKKTAEKHKLVEDQIYSSWNNKDDGLNVKRKEKIRNTFSYITEDLWVNLFATGWLLEANRQMYNYDLSKYDIENSCQISKYTSNINSFFAPHSDFSGLVNQNNPIHTRKLSLSIQLSSEDDYEGGDLLLYYHQQSTKLDGKPVLNEFLVPKALGTVVVFDSRIVHEVTPIISGTRHALVKWYHGDTPLR